MPAKLSRVQILALIVVIVIVALGLNSTGFLSGSVISPSYNGVHSDIFGFQECGSNTVYSPNNQGITGVTYANPNGNLPNPGNCPQSSTFLRNYNWQYNPGSTTVNLNGVGPLGGIITSTVVVTSNVQPVINQATNQQTCTPINYWVKNPYATNSINYVNVNGNICLYQMQIVLNSQSNSDPNIQFKGDQFWFRLYNSNWNNYQLSSNPNPSNGTNAGYFGSTVAMILVNGQQLTTQGGPTNSGTSPDWRTTQQQITLFNSPQVSSNIPSQVPTSGTNQSLANGGSPYAPDTQMTQTEYFSVTLTDFGASQCGIAFCAAQPEVALNFQFYELQLGVSLWSNPFRIASTTQGSVCTGSGSFQCAITGGLAWLFETPLGQLEVTFFIFAVLIIVVVVVSKRIPSISPRGFR